LFRSWEGKETEGESRGRGEHAKSTLDRTSGIAPDLLMIGPDKKEACTTTMGKGPAKRKSPFRAKKLQPRPETYPRSRRGDSPNQIPSVRKNKSETAAVAAMQKLSYNWEDQLRGGNRVAKSRTGSSRIEGGKENLGKKDTEGAYESKSPLGI